MFITMRLHVQMTKDKIVVYGYYEISCLFSSYFIVVMNLKLNEFSASLIKHCSTTMDVMNTNLQLLYYYFISASNREAVDCRQLQAE
jgi:hypothetical protein